jgi:drug/metabolite transporter (DMT)-like permease
MIGIVGVVALVGLDLSGSGAALLGAIAILVASVAYAAGGLILKHHLPGPSPVGVVTAIMVAAAIMLAPLAALTAPDQTPGAGPIAAIATLGLLGTGIAFVLFYGLIHKVGPGKALIVSYLAPGFAVIYGALLLDEAITAGTLIGLALILAGSWLAAEGGIRRRRAPGATPPEADVPIGGIAAAEAAATAAANR